MASFLVLTNFVFLFLGSGEIQPWNEPKARKDTDGECGITIDKNNKDNDKKDFIKERTL